MLAGRAVWPHPDVRSVDLIMHDIHATVFILREKGTPHGPPGSTAHLLFHCTTVQLAPPPTTTTRATSCIVFKSLRLQQQIVRYMAAQEVRPVRFSFCPSITVFLVACMDL